MIYLEKRAGDYITLDRNYLLNSLLDEKEYTVKKVILLHKNSRLEKDISAEDVVFDKSETRNMLNAVYTIYVYVEKENFSNSFKIGEVKILNSLFFTEDEYENTLSHDEKMIKIIKQALENRIEQQYLSISFQGKSITKYTPSELLELLKYYENKVARIKYNKLTQKDKSKLSILYFDY